MKSFLQEAEQVSGFGHEFVVKARTVAAMFGVPVEWLLAAMSWETSQYKAYHAGNGGSAPHWSTNIRRGRGIDWIHSLYPCDRGEGPDRPAG